MKKHLIFDFGAVVFQWRPAEMLARVLPQRAVEAAATAALQRDFFQGHGGEWGRFDQGLIEVPALVEGIAARTGLHPSEVQAVVEAVPDELQPIAETVAWIGRLREAGHRLFYLSNMPAPYADHLERQHGFLSAFEDGVFSSRVRLAKPDAAIFTHALARFGVAAEDCVFLDDHLANTAAAQALGIESVLFGDVVQACDELRQRGIAVAP